MCSSVRQRDEAILRHVQRYRITTRKALHRTLFPKVAINAVTKVTTRLLAEGWLNQYPVFYKSHYFTLAPRAADLLRTTEAGPVLALDTGGLDADSFRASYGVLAFCCLLKTPRCRLLACEVEKDYPQLYFPDLDSDRYFLDATQRPMTSGIMFVDDGRGVERMVAGYHDDLRTRCGRPDFQEFLGAARFRLAVVTATTERAAAIGHCLRQQEWPQRLRTSVEVAPKLTYCFSDANELLASYRAGQKAEPGKPGKQPDKT